MTRLKSTRGRVVLSFKIQFDLENADETLAYVQAQALGILALCHSQQKKLVGLGYKSANKLYGACARLGLFDEVNSGGGPRPSESLRDTHHSWNEWRAAETRRRTGLFIWVSMKSY